MTTRRMLLLVLGAVALLLLDAPPGRAWTPGDVAPDARVYEPVDESPVTLYQLLGDGVGLVWIWTDAVA